MPLDNSEIGTGVGRSMPQGRDAHCPVPNQIVTEEAKLTQPKGRVLRANFVSSPIGSRKANVGVLEDQQSSADRDPNLTEAGEAVLQMPTGQSGAAKPASAPSPSAEARPCTPQGHQPDAAALGELCGNLMGLQRQRIFAIRQQSRLSRSLEAFVRIQLGYHTGLPEKERKRLSKLATDIIAAIESERPIPPAGDRVAANCAPEILITRESRLAWDQRRGETEKRMVELAKALPAQSFVASTKGFTHLGLAVLVGEAGDLASYPKKGHLWKRLGLAVIDGYRQGQVPPGLARDDRAEAWKARGYNPARRAEVYAFIDDVMLRAQWRGAKIDDAGEIIEAPHAIGPYGAYYGRKRYEYTERWAEEKTVAGHANAAARRYVSKMFVRDLWKAWRADVAISAELP